MPRKKDIVDLPQPQPESEEEEQIIEPPIVVTAKAKKIISPERKAHLDNIRAKAIEAKQKQKEITLKAKLAKTLMKQEEAKKYDELISKQNQQPPTAPVQHHQPQPVSETPQPLPPQRKIKKIVYEDEEDQDKLNYMLYMQSQRQLEERVLNERLKHTIMSYQHALQPQRY